MALRMKHEMARLRDELRYEPVEQRLRISYDGHPVADTTSAILVWEPRTVVPSYAVPLADLLVEHVSTEHRPPDPADVPVLLIPERSHVHLAPGQGVSLTVAGETLTEVGFTFADPDLAGYVWLAWKPFTWVEEAEEKVSHAHDPFSRIDVLPSDRSIEVRFGDQTLAASSRARLLVETGLPPRWYLPREDVRLDLLEDSPTQTWCAYKGRASYLSVKDAPSGQDLAWFYPDPLHDAVPVHDLVCFWGERTQLVLDGSPVSRPDSPFPDGHDPAVVPD